MEQRAVWFARVHGQGGRFERAELAVDGSGRFVLRTWNRGDESADVAVIDRDDVVRLCEVLEDELHRGDGGRC
jgi:hypothetical protein